MYLISILKCAAGLTLLTFALFLSPFNVRGQTDQENESQPPIQNYRIGAGDVLKIVVIRQDQLSNDAVRVKNDGTIRIPMVRDDVRAACLTEVELADAIAKIYREFLLNPEVSVDVTEFQSNPVALIGAVNQPGRFDLRRPTRLLELLTFVNGPAQNAGDTVQIIRNTRGFNCEKGWLVNQGTDSDQEVLSVRLSKTLKGELDSNPLIASGDIITVAEATAIPEAYIVGNVKRATPIQLKERTTLTKAIAMAGGMLPDAKRSSIKIYRQDPVTFAKSEIIVNLKQIGTDGDKDVVLQPNDIVEVPGPSGAKKFLRDIFRVLVPTLGRVVPVY